MKKINIFWFRRDLRLEDNKALHAALNSDREVLPVFIFDTHILHDLKDEADARVSFIHLKLKEIQSKLNSIGSSLYVFHGTISDAFFQLTTEYDINTVFANEDYEPYALKRDNIVRQFLATKNITFELFTDQVIFPQNKVLKADGKPYTVFTPYSRKWKEYFNSNMLYVADSKSVTANFIKHKPFFFPAITDLGFRQSAVKVPDFDLSEKTLKSYAENRDFPALDSTSYLSTHLRFGTISIRKVVDLALKTNEIFLNELIWREFFMQILFHFPKVVHNSFKEKYDRIEWRNDETEFQAWCAGETGYPIVDAGMRQLNETGLMHNRVRMVVASFLTKHLLIDWRWGEAYFAEKLLDYELASNNGNWQWAASSGCDAVPYFRIFNPESQQKKFDPNFVYIKKWIPELETFHYPVPIVEHKFARERALNTFKKALKE